MLRAVLVGLLSLSAVACKSGDDSPKSQPGVAAGKVIEVTGTVMVRHNDVARPLAKGETVEGDDVVETGADGNVIIELSHNLARWELGANKKSKVSASAAWSLAKKTGDVATVEQQSAAAGRHAERSAAETSVSAGAEGAADLEQAKAAPKADMAPPAKAERAPAAEPPAAAAPAAAAPAPDPAPSQSPRGESPRRRAAAPTDTATESVGAPPASGGAPNVTAQLEAAPAPMSPADADKAAVDVVLANEKSIKACLTKDAQAVNVTIKVAANGTATAIVSGKADVPAGVQRCVKAAVAKMKFAKAATTVKLEVSR